MSLHALIFALATAGSTAALHPTVQDFLVELLPMTRNEQRALGAQHRREYTFAQIDVDRDGLISQEEWAAQNWARLRLFDANADGLLTVSEYATSICPIPLSGNLRETDVLCIEGRARRLRELDASSDGLLSQAEHGRGSLDYFRQADLCRDGVLQPEELNGDIRRRRKTCEEVTH